jgi:hypothetical protein
MPAPLLDQIQELREGWISKISFSLVMIFFPLVGSDPLLPPRESF